MRRFRMVAAAGLVLATGCHSYDLGPAPVPSAYVRVHFGSPRPIAIALEGLDTLHLTAATRLEGRVLAARGHTITLAVRAVHTRDGPVREIVGKPATAVVRLEPGTATEVRRVDALETAFAAVVIPALVAIGLFVLFVATFEGA